MKLKVPWTNNSVCANSVEIHNNKYERKHRLNGQHVCSVNDKINQLVMERNTAIIDLTIKVTFSYKNVLKVQGVGEP